ncbi:uncharacterized protein LOC120138909 [Hibiscus syriacus]|uniref:uncharacterized protein LOC120138909 n=1 Tax=Hibiscus syriacus TaxID=106335 RepID=UPI0019222E5D|nr:uncharacterized protein LOC120138909 [Hibiscus syriacus]
MGEVASDQGTNKPFSDFIHIAGLTDLGYQGPPYTLSRGNSKQWLDRCIANSSWVDQFPESYVKHLERIGLDHRPILLRLEDEIKDKQNMPFRFLAAWHDHPQFKELLNSTWKVDETITANV